MKLYAYTLPQVPEKAGWLKIGQTTGSIEKRINDQLSQAHLKAEIVLRESAAAGKNKVTDKEVHRELVQRGFVQDGNSEWFRCTAGDVRDALNTVKERYRKEDKRKELEQKFYEELRNWYYWATEEHRSGLHRREYDADHALRIIVRLLLIFFLKEKGLVPSELFQEEWLNANLKEDEFGYYNVILRNLFFHSLNTPHNERGELENRNLIQRYNKVKEALHKRIPFLNGGLFTEQSGDDFALNDDYFFSKARLKEIKALDKTCSVTGIIKILSQYKYTLDETDNSEFIDPEFVGNIFESLLACIAADKKKNRRKITGSYYTPREIVNYMVNEALDTYLSTQKDSDFENALLRCSILDPSCGSGAFPCGVMNVIMQRLDPNKTLTQDNRYQTKLKILRNVIYGIDIQPMAVHIASLRLFLSLLQEITPDKSKANFGIEPLPNLDYKFAVADTLFGIDFNDLFFNEHRTEFLQIQTLKADYFKESIVSAKEHLRTQITAAEKELADKSGNKGIQALCQWNHSDTQASPYFDSRWMFGIENFDIVIGNPPYGAKYPKEHKAYFLKHYESAKTADINENGTVVGKLKGSLDTFSLFIEWAFRNVKKNGYVHFIVPLAVVSSDSMTALHQLLFDNCETIRISHYAVRPRKVFHNSEIDVSIINFCKDEKPCKNLLTTKLNRKTEDSPIEKITKKLKFVNSFGLTMPGRIPKIGTKIEQRILKKLLRCKTTVGDLITEDGKAIYYRVSGGRYYKIITSYSTDSTKEKPLIFDKKLADCVGAMLSSNLFFWFYQVYSNNHDLKSFEIEAFPIPAARLTPELIVKIKRLYKRYLNDIERNVIHHSSTTYANIDSFKEYKIRYSKPLIDAIDDLICPLYGLTDKEREFIKNYEIEFRIDD